MIFAKWIDKMKESVERKSNPYIFKQIYRASRDGNTVAAFHNKCDNKGATIVIAKIRDSEQIVGVYNGIQIICLCLI
jgi:hypothetical protein